MIFPNDVRLLNRGLIGRPEWTTAPFIILTDGGLCPVVGQIKGALSIHQTKNAAELFALSHLPTGLRIVWHPNVEFIRYSADRLLDLWDWNVDLPFTLPTEALSIIYELREHGCY